MRNKGYYKLVHAILQDNIRQGRIPTGTRLYTAAVADRLTLSPPPVKRALDLLQKEGVLSEHPQHGYVVGNLSDDAAQQGRENLYLLNLDLSLLAGGKATPLAPRWETILEEVEQHVLHSIPFGTFQISESGICDHFGVSRTVSREVLARLDVQGLVEKSRSSHWIVGPLSARTLDETHEMRRLLEPQALVDALPQIDTRHIQAMRDEIGSIHLQGGKGDGDPIAAHERALHGGLLEMGRNRRMIATVRNLQVSHVVDELFRAHIDKPDEASLLEEHDIILLHLLKRDAEGAALALRRHLDLQHQRTRARLKVLSIFDAPNVFPYLTRIH